MNFKLLETMLGTRQSFSCFMKTLRDIPRLRWGRTKNRHFSTSKEDKEEEVKELLDKSSPLKGFDDQKEDWGTSPYPPGTIFKTTDLLVEPAPITSSEASIIMFPGQGNQFVGMSKNLKKYPAAVEMFAAASEILQYDLLKLCDEGPEDKLNDTEYCQPATLVCSLAALEILKEEKPWAINNCVGTCGYSLGEFSALVFAGCINFERAVRLVHLRAKAMALCSLTRPGGMMTVLMGSSNELSKGMQDAVAHCKSLGMEDPCCHIASYLFAGCKVVAGDIEALNFLSQNSKKYKLGKLVKLPVSGAFHTPLMNEAQVTFNEAIKNIEFKNPLILVYSSVNGKSYSDGNAIKKQLKKQICGCVKWEQTMHSVFLRDKKTDFPVAYECGPGKSLTTVLRKLYPKSVLSYGVKL